MVSLPKGYQIRRTEVGDYLGVMDTLKVLTEVGHVPREQFVETITYWNSVQVPWIGSKSHGNGVQPIKAYDPLVITNESGRVVATGTIVIEAKLIHSCGLVGHIEDVAVASDQQGKQLGLLLIEHLTEIGRKAGCYKIILDCSVKNVEFYKKCGYTQVGLEMEFRF